VIRFSVRTAARAALLIAAAVSLSGCISLLPKVDPAQTYRFGFGAAAPEGSSPASRPGAFGVMKARTGFVRAAAGDQILTVAPGGETAYIAGARWVSPAIVLFDEAQERAFDADPGRARLISRGEVGRAELVLKLDVRAFEAAYPNGVKSTPTVRVEVRALLTRSQDRTLVGDQVFAANVPASDNRVGAIAEAFDKATAQVLGQVIGMVNAAAPVAQTSASVPVSPPLSGGPQAQPTTPATVAGVLPPAQ
jgi:cholesterol transport system auxiliary component